MKRLLAKVHTALRYRFYFMKNIFKQFWQKRKYLLLGGLILDSLLNFIFNYFPPKENILNFFILYIIIPVLYVLIYLFIEKRIRKRKEADS